MALTKVTGHVVQPDTNIQFHNTKSTGIITATDTTQSTSTTTGALQIAGGVGIGDASPSYMLDVAGAINSQTDVKVNGVSVAEQALNDAVAMAIALG